VLDRLSRIGASQLSDAPAEAARQDPSSSRSAWPTSMGMMHACRRLVLLFLLALAWLPGPSASATDVVPGSGVAVSDTKESACATALTYARREALETAGVRVQAELSMRDVLKDEKSSSRAESKIDQATAGLVKTVDKSLATVYDAESGSIRCTAKARFEIERTELLEALSGAQSPPAKRADASAIEISGDWTTTWVDRSGQETETLVRFVQTGNAVRGIYFTQSVYEGVLNGNRLVGIWRNAKNHGRFEYEFDSDGQTFAGKWGYGTDPLEYWQVGKRALD
jgi:hypothetical protein